MPLSSWPQITFGSGLMSPVWCGQAVSVCSSRAGTDPASKNAIKTKAKRNQRNWGMGVDR